MHVKSRFEELFSTSGRTELERYLVEYIAPRRWFRSKTRTIAGVSIEEVVPLPIAAVQVALTVVRVRYTVGPSEDYVLPLAWIDGDAGEQLVRARPHLLVATVQVDAPAAHRLLVDALGEPRALDGLRELVTHGALVRADGCTLSFRPVGPAAGIGPATPRPVDVEQSNTSVVYGEACILKVIRKLEEGTSPDLEMGEFLTRAGYTHAPRLLGAIELQRPSGEPATIGMMHEFVPNDGDAWSFTLATIRRSFAASATIGNSHAVESGVAFVRPLAQRVAQMHVVLSSPTSDVRFAPEPIEREEREALGRAASQSLEAAWTFVRERASDLPPHVVDRLRALRAREEDYRRCIAAFVDGGHHLVKTRIHGDLHLGQVLVAGDDFMLIDFEGEPARSLAERRAKRSPFADVAGILRSLQYASVSAARAAASSDEAFPAFVEAWHRQARRSLLRAYFDTASTAAVLSDEAAVQSVLLPFYLLEKCVYELHYELNNRPDWVAIPVLGLEQILEDDDAA